MATTYGDPLIGVDIKLNGNDLGVTQSGDLALIGQDNSADNVWQAVWLRLITTLGTYLFADEYGTQARQFIDEPITDKLLAALTTEASNTISQDPRVASISNLKVVQVDARIQISFGITTVSGSSAYGTNILS
jgi:phage baseplate assembly protein W